MTVIEIIQLVATIASSGAVALILGAQIKSQQEQINAMKSYMDIFKIDEVKKYIELRVDSAEKETIKKMQESFDKYISTSPEAQKTLDDFADKSLRTNNEFLKRVELTTYITQILSVASEETAEYQMKEFLPLNYEEIKNNVKYARTIFLANKNKDIE